MGHIKPKIVFLGAGSTVFAKHLLGDILAQPALANSHIVLQDIDAERLRVSEIVARRVALTLQISPTVEATLDRRVALHNADYVITMFQIGGYHPGTVTDFEVPKKYGLRQTIADTLGIGGIMRALRTIPVLLAVCRDMEELCPRALLLNYVNPMVMNCWAIARASSITCVGLCHSVPFTALQLATDLGVSFFELDYLVAGINHLAFFLRLEHKGIDLYPRLHEFMRSEGFPPMREFEGLGGKMADHLRYELFRHFGYFVTESSEHLSEYVPWFIKRDRPDLIQQFQIPLDEYVRRCEYQIAEWKAQSAQLEQDEGPIEIKPSVEYGSHIIDGCETGTPKLIYGNVPNEGIISNLPAGVPVEVPCLVDRNGVQPTAIGVLPPHLAALMQTNINVQALTVEAALTGRREHIYHAAMLDPHTAAELDLDQIRSLVDDLIEAHGDWLPEFH